MQTLLRPDELRSSDEITVPSTEPPRRQELQTACNLMDVADEA
ncbi:hypothetical protein [Streptomyces gilvosporeus]|nr:hypothetical protein [Streptomyces gilvosporeus]